MCGGGGRGWGRSGGGGGGGGNWRRREIHLPERKTITGLLLNDSPNRLTQRPNKFIRRC